MTYGIKGRKRRSIPKPEYFKKREIRDLWGAKKKPSYSEIGRAGARQVGGVHKKVFKEGRIVSYKGSLARVEKVSKKGVHIRPIKRDSQGFPTLEQKKTKFLTVKQVEKGAINPFFTNVPDFVFGLSRYNP